MNRTPIADRRFRADCINIGISAAEHADLVYQRGRLKLIKLAAQVEERQDHALAIALMSVHDDLKRPTDKPRKMVDAKEFI